MYLSACMCIQRERFKYRLIFRLHVNSYYLSFYFIYFFLILKSYHFKIYSLDSSTCLCFSSCFTLYFSLLCCSTSNISDFWFSSLPGSHLSCFLLALIPSWILKTWTSGCLLASILIATSWDFMKCEMMPLLNLSALLSMFATFTLHIYIYLYMYMYYSNLKI